MSRLLATVLIAATLGLASPGGVRFRCRFDGVVRITCCCENERSRSTHEHPAVAQAMAGTCCDLLVGSPVTREAMKVATAPRLADIPAVILPTPTPRPASSVPASARQISWTGPSGPGRPLFLQSCSLLI